MEWPYDLDLACHRLLVWCFMVFRSYFFLYECFTFVYICAPHTCRALEARTQSWFPWNWSCRLLYAAVWMLETEPGFYGGHASTFNCWATPPTLVLWALLPLTNDDSSVSRALLHKREVLRSVSQTCMHGASSVANGRIPALGMWTASWGWSLGFLASQPHLLGDLPTRGRLS